ncbi:AAA family ATPase [Actinomadura hibisca]|uniref:AAA family ATPase n=1 Tax=Actinomadura hibisca TaxID=68565 RepID=UPI0035A2230B
MPLRMPARKLFVTHTPYLAARAPTARPCPKCHNATSSPMLIVVSGPSGSGKTTLARTVAAQIGCPLIVRRLNVSSIEPLSQRPRDPRSRDSVVCSEALHDVHEAPEVLTVNEDIAALRVL